LRIEPNNSFVPTRVGDAAFPQRSARGTIQSLYRGSRQSLDMIIHLLSALVVVTSAMFFIGFTVLVFAKPAVAERFLMKFASSARTHFIEQSFRVLLGASLVIYSSAMRQTDIFRLFGWVIVISSVVLMILPWQWHHRFGKKLLPVMIQYMRFYAIAVFALGVVILYAMLAPQLKGAV